MSGSQIVINNLFAESINGLQEEIGDLTEIVERLAMRVVEIEQRINRGAR